MTGIYKPALFVASLIITLLIYAAVAQGQMVTSSTIEPAYCERILHQVEHIAGCKAIAPIQVDIIDRTLDAHSPGLMVLGHGVIGLYEQDVRRITIVRDKLSPWLIAHEMSHVIFSDNYSFHPESWVELTATLAAGKCPHCVRLDP